MDDATKQKEEKKSEEVRKNLDKFLTKFLFEAKKFTKKLECLLDDTNLSGEQVKVIHRAKEILDSMDKTYVNNTCNDNEGTVLFIRLDSNNHAIKSLVPIEAINSISKSKAIMDFEKFFFDNEENWVVEWDEHEEFDRMDDLITEYNNTQLEYLKKGQ